MAKRNDTNANADTIENTETVTDTAVEGQMSEQQEQLVEDKSVNAEIETLFTDVSALAEAYNNEAVSNEEILELFNTGKLNDEQVKEITGTNVEGVIASIEAEKTEPSEDNLTPGSLNSPGIGHNAQYAYMVDNLSHFEGLEATDLETAREHLKAVLDRVIEHETTGVTSLTSATAIAAADYLRFVTGLNGGSHMVPVDPSLYDKALKNIQEFVPDEAKTPYFKTVVGAAIKRAILIMVGKAQIGWFMLPQDRKVVGANDIAFSEAPTTVPDGFKPPIRSVCIKSNVLKPRIPVWVNKVLQQWVDNESEDLVLLTNIPTDCLYDSLWDLEGKLQYDPAPLRGDIISFTSGKRIAEIELAAKIAAEKKLLDDEAAKNAPVTPTPRQTAGTQAEGEPTTDKAMLQQFREENAVLKAQNAALTNPDAKNLTDAFLQLEAHIGTHPISQDAQSIFYRATNKMLKEQTLGSAELPGRENARQMVRMFMQLDGVLDWNDQKGVWIITSRDGSKSEEFEFKREELLAA